MISPRRYSSVPARSFEPGEHIVHFFGRDIDEGHDVCAAAGFSHADLAFDLPLGEAGKEPMEIRYSSIFFSGLAPKVLGGSCGRSATSSGEHFQFSRLGRLYLERFVDQIAQHLHSQS